MKLVAYHNNPQLKADIITQLEVHRAADQLIKGQYWEDGKGCAVGCTIHSGDHMEYETRFGIPVMIARLEDCIFEGLPNDLAQEWPIRLMTAIKPGQDLSRVGWQFLHRLLIDLSEKDYATPVKDVIIQSARVVHPATQGGRVDHAGATRAAVNAAAHGAADALDMYAAGAARSAAIAAHAAAAADAAADAAYSAYAAVNAAAYTAARAAIAATHAADALDMYAAGAAAAARVATCATAYSTYADWLIELIEETGEVYQ